MSEITKYFDVVMLMADVREARELSLVFKKVGINPICYTEYGPFWHGILNRPPSLALIDISLMGQGHLPLKEHPLIKGGQLPIAFFYKDEHRPLLSSTLDYAHYGLIRKQADYEAPLKSLLLRVNQHLALEGLLKQKELELGKREAQLARLLKDNEELRLQLEASTELKNFQFDGEALRNAQDFSTWLVAHFEKWPWIKRFALYEYSLSEKKLITPPVVSPKYVPLPALQVSAGPSPVMQNMAAQVALENLGPKLISLNLIGPFENPSIMVFLEIKEHHDVGKDLFQDDRFQPSWPLIENFLSGAYAIWELQHFTIPKNSTKERSLYDVLALADREFFGDMSTVRTAESGVDFVFIGLDISFLDHIIKKHPENRFFWQKFGQDFKSRIQNVLRHDDNAFISVAGPYSYIMAIPQAFYQRTWDQVRDLAQRFSYWRYFENPEKIFVESVRPLTRQLPESSDALLNFIDNPATQFTSVSRRKTGEQMEVRKENFASETRP
ncbi:MAG: hypothetical protein A2X86_06435 [Bdellovibrionales bacterium GWA2_49_15]|nr:MAG: hypothetical protein A2X86_06435 [Bdellovibrionales bacterium GWA2_49_15]HAZ12090.1 hypothetical protein [Bdellovibrionales bacterium]